MIIRHFGNGKELKTVEVAPVIQAPIEPLQVDKIQQISVEPLKSLEPIEPLQVDEQNYTPKGIYFYTVTSSNYHHITKKSIHSFLNNCDPNQIFHIYHSDEILDKVIHDRIIYVNIKENVYREGYSIEKLGIRKYSLFSKAIADKVTNLHQYEWVVFADSDILYFKDIFSYIKELDKSKAYFCINGVRDVERTYININSGYLVFTPQNMFYSEWRIEMDRMIKANEDIKYLDQDALIHVFAKKPEKCGFIPLSILSFKGRRENCWATHYIARKLFRFEADYNELIVGEVKKTVEIQNTTLVNKPNLIYTCVTGSQQYKQMCCIWAKAIRKFGNYTDALIIFTDKNEYMDEIKDICQIREVTFKPIIAKEGKEGFSRDCYYNRMTISDHFNPEEYNQICYLDNDCLVKKDINEIFCSNGEFVYVEQHRDSNDDWFGYLFDATLDKTKYRAINAGTFIIPGNKFKEYTNVWINLIKNNPDKTDRGDQPYINYIIRKGFIPGKKLDDKFVAFRQHSNGIIEHYIGNGKRKFGKMIGNYNLMNNRCNDGLPL
jgi:hypothetical protein